MYRLHVHINIERSYANHIQVFKKEKIFDFYFHQKYQ